VAEQKKKPVAVWEQALRRTLKAEHGKGWSLRESRGRAQLVQILEDRSRRSTKLDIIWASKNARLMLEAVAQLREYLDGGMDWDRAVAARAELTVHSTGTTKATKQVDWGAACDRFFESRSNRRSSTLSDLRTRLRRVREVMASKPRVTDGPGLMRRYAALHFADCPPGGQGRKRQLQDLSAFLLYCCDDLGFPARWMPLSTAKRQELVGSPPTTGQKKEKRTIPVMPDDFEDLLAQMLQDGRKQLWLMTAMIGFYGLREGEICLLDVDENGDVYVGGELKRDLRALQSGAEKEERLALGLDLKGQPGEARRVAQLFRSGQIGLPKAVKNQIDKVSERNSYREVGAAYAQILKRYKPWQELVKRNPGLRPYGLRHGWAWRAHKYSSRPLHYSQAAAFMGHSVETHLKYYSSWVNRKELEEAGKKYNEALQSA